MTFFKKKETTYSLLQTRLNKILYLYKAHAGRRLRVYQAVSKVLQICARCYLIIENPSSESDEITFIKQNFSIIVSLVERMKDNNDFALDKRIFRSSNPVMKNFRISDEVYKQFVATCEQQFPHLRIQDIISQLILNFVD